MDPRAKNPEEAYKNRQQGLLKARKAAQAKFESGEAKPGPRVHSTADEALEYMNDKLQKDRSDLQWWISHYKKQPLWLRSQIANHPKFQDILVTINADIALGLYKVSREEWNALTVLFNRLTKLMAERESTKRKAVNKSTARFLNDDKTVVDAVRLEIDSDG